MAIFNRKDEIQMMKLIGADRGFIRGPFIVEAIIWIYRGAGGLRNRVSIAVFGTRQAGGAAADG